MNEIWVGLTVGLAAGFTPGPLFTLVITSTLRRGFWAGAKVAIAPLLSDLPVIAICLWLISEMDDVVVGWLGVVGGIYLLYLAYRTVQAGAAVVVGNGTPELPDPDQRKPWAERDFIRGLLVNLLSPHPWVFWITVGAPLVDNSPVWWATTGFLITFYGLLVGGKVALAAVIATGRKYLTETWTRRLEITGGIMLGLLGVWLVATYWSDIG